MKTTAIFADQMHAADAIAAFRTKGVSDDNLSILTRDANTSIAGTTLGGHNTPAIGAGRSLDEGTRDIATGTMSTGAVGTPGVGPGIDGDTDRFIDSAGEQELTEQGQRHAARGLIGGGALGGGLAAVAMLAIPGIGPIAAAGTIAAMLTGGVATGASLGGLREILTNHGHDEDEATTIAEGIDKGGVMVSIDTDGSGIDHGTAIDIIENNGGAITGRRATIDA